MNEEHLINQMLTDENINEKLGYFERVNNLYNDYINTLNNETKQYLNMEDERTGRNEKYIKTEELSLCIDENPLLKVGGCEREIYFKIHGFTGSPKNFTEIENFEKDELLKKQWLRKLSLANVLTDVEQGVIKDLKGIIIKSTTTTFIKDFEKNAVCTLLIKPVNDTAQAIRRQLWDDFKNLKPFPLKVHLPEALALLIFYRIPVKILYVGKNNSALIKSFTLTLKDNCLVVDGEKMEGVTIKGISKSLGILKKAITEKIVPPRGFIRPRVLTSKEVGLLIKERFVSSRDGDDLIRGDIYEPFQCKLCKFKENCNSLSDGFVKETI